MNTVEIAEQIKSVTVTAPSEPRDVRGELGLLSEEEYIRLRDITLGGARNERAKGKGPPFVRIGSAIRYPRGKLVEYAMDRLHRSTAEYDGGRQNGGRPRTLPRCPHCDQPLPRHLRGAVTDAT